MTSADPLGSHHITSHHSGWLMASAMAELNASSSALSLAASDSADGGGVPAGPYLPFRGGRAFRGAAAGRDFVGDGPAPVAHDRAALAAASATRSPIRRSVRTPSTGAPSAIAFRASSYAATARCT